MCLLHNERSIGRFAALMLEVPISHSNRKMAEIASFVHTLCAITDSPHPVSCSPRALVIVKLFGLDTPDLFRTSIIHSMVVNMKQLHDSRPDPHSLTSEPVKLQFSLDVISAPLCPWRANHNEPCRRPNRRTSLTLSRHVTAVAPDVSTFASLLCPSVMAYALTNYVSSRRCPQQSRERVSTKGEGRCIC